MARVYEAGAGAAKLALDTQTAMMRFFSAARLVSQYSGDASRRVRARWALLVLFFTLLGCSEAKGKAEQLDRLLVLALGEQRCWLDAQELRVQQPMMGTLVMLTIRHQGDYARAAQSAARAFRIMAQAEAVLSAFAEHGDVARINRNAGRAVPVRPETLDLLGLAKTLQSWTQGGFDPTVAACAIDWHQPQLPSMDQIEQCKPLIGMDKIDVDGRRRVVALRLPGMKLSFGGVAKGYIAELGSISLRRDGFPEHSVEAGGDLRLAATARPWRVALAAPGLQFEWREGAVASSGDQFQALDEDGRHYHHLLDPRHGGAALGLSSVSVLAPSAGVADGLATGLFALGPEEGWARACELSRLAKSGAMPAPIEALFLLSDGSLRSTPGFPPLSPLDG